MEMMNLSFVSFDISFRYNLKMNYFEKKHCCNQFSTILNDNKILRKFNNSNTVVNFFYL